MEKTKLESVTLNEETLAKIANLQAINPDGTEAEEKVKNVVGNFYRYLLFQLENEQYGININYIVEIISYQEVTHLPGMPRFVRGLMNLRGKIIPVIDAREKFGKQKAIYNDKTCIVVLQVEEIIVGLIVDTISDVISVNENVLEEAPKIGKIKTNKYINNIAKINNEVKLLIDCEKLINE